MALKLNMMQVDGDGNFPSGAVTGVDSAAITDGTIVTADIATGGVATADILDATILAGDLASNAVETAKIKDANVTNAKMKKPCLRIYQQTCAVADFTDSSTTGTLALSTTIPAGALYIGTTIHALVGFAGDTTAVITVGDGTDVDRYNTGTPDVFTTAAAGVDMGVPAGTTFHAAAKTPTLVITAATDFTAVVTDGNGTLVVTLYYYEPV